MQGGYFVNGNNQMQPQQVFEAAPEAPLYQTYYQTPPQLLQPPPQYCPGAPYNMPQGAPLQAFNSGNGNYLMPPQEGIQPMKQLFFQVPMMMMPPPTVQGPTMVSFNTHTFHISHPEN